MPDPEISYFELQAYVGTTKHMGGLETTKELIELCHINKGSYVLDVGCGVGATACYLAKRFGCRVIGVDIQESMIARSEERAQKEGVENLVEFKVADAQNLPFENALFDAVLCESVVTFIEDKQRVVSECARVTKSGGYVGLNEELWLKTPPAQVVERVRHIWSIKPNILTLEGWVELLEGAGLSNIVARTYKFDARRESTQVKRYRFEDMWRMFYRTLFLYIKSPAFRRYMAADRYLPKDTFEYLGYAIFAGRKP
ncbi:MAG: methyltransferase domain-containing protein [Anaerolineae bacterium]|jgi:ubiquinone/menaquinone biosynthesis C-methylase UbiE|nr:methyltransferase domain-containing protein [Anaerolineae bacterium]MDH7474808.1 class I SAM-dependent methyltransferase [Anaerolineae bacterium]